MSIYIANNLTNCYFHSSLLFISIDLVLSFPIRVFSFQCIKNKNFFFCWFFVIFLFLCINYSCFYSLNVISLDECQVNTEPKINWPVHLQVHSKFLPELLMVASARWFLLNNSSIEILKLISLLNLNLPSMVGNRGKKITEMITCWFKNNNNNKEYDLKQEL